MKLNYYLNSHINCFYCLNVQIMIRTRGLRETLGRIIGRALVSGDADETPQRRRPIASARRQQAVAPVAEDVKHVDHAADKVHEQPEEAVTDDVAADAQGFPGGRTIHQF